METDVASAATIARRKPAQIATLDRIAASRQDAREPASFRSVLPVERAQRSEVLVEEDAGDGAA